MRIFGLQIKKADKRSNNGKNFTDEDRELSAEIREMRREYKRLQEERKLLVERDRIEQLRSDLGYYDTEEQTNNPEDNAETLLLKAFLPTVLKGQNNFNPLTSNNTATNTPSEVTLSQEQIKQTIEALPKKVIRYAKTMNDELKVQLIRTQMPNISEKSINDLLTYFNSKYVK